MSKIHEALKRAAGESGTTPSVPPVNEGKSVVHPDADPVAVPVQAIGGGPDQGVADPAAAGDMRSAEGAPSLQFNRLRAYQLEPHSSMVTEHEPKSLAAEQFRTLRTRIQRLTSKSPRRLLLVTSPGPGDGKTLVSTNLALTLAQEVDSRVLLIDCDLRRPSLQQYFGLPDDQQPGLQDYLTGQVSLEKAIWRFGGTSLHVLTSGPLPQNPSELLGSRRMVRTLRYLASQFDYVVMDAPPLNAVADPAILIPLADGVLTVVRYGQTGRAGLAKALEAIPEEKALGLVFNAAEMRFSGYYYSYDYGEK